MMHDRRGGIGEESVSPGEGRDAKSARARTRARPRGGAHVISCQSRRRQAPHLPGQRNHRFPFTRLENDRDQDPLHLASLSLSPLLAGCSSGDGEITVEGSKTPLTDNAGTTTPSRSR